MPIIAEREGRFAFGHNPLGYDAVRPPYPEAVFSVLREQHDYPAVLVSQGVKH